MAASDIVVQGAREHNLRNVNVVLPRNQLICLTGVSGSGKSSLAFDTVYAEGQRRYIESLSTYARQFIGQMAKPNVDRIEGLSPSICISQKTAGDDHGDLRFFEDSLCANGDVLLSPMWWADRSPATSADC
jgi:excinuclease ABC subunit A